MEQSPLGVLYRTGESKALSGLFFEGKEGIPPALSLRERKDSLFVFDQARRWLDLYFSGRNPDFIPKLEYGKTSFSKAVYDILLSVPYGETITYKEVAEALGRKKGFQAVGQVIKHNPILLRIPCHRVIHSDGKRGGYAGGIHRKEALLGLEKRSVRHLLKD